MVCLQEYFALRTRKKDKSMGSINNPAAAVQNRVITATGI